MALGKSKSKMGSMMGVDLKSVGQTATTHEPIKEEPTNQSKQNSTPATPKPQIIAPTSNGGRPKFELMAGEDEKKVNFFCPEVLYTAIYMEAIKQKKTIKQFICEVLLDEMSSKYGFKME